MRNTNNNPDFQQSKDKAYPLIIKFTFENSLFGTLEIWDKAQQISVSYIHLELWDKDPQKVLLNCIKHSISKPYPSYDITLNLYKRS